jgi:multidrug resistance efflux pump
MNEITVSLPDSIEQIDRLLDVHHENWHENWLTWLCSQVSGASAALLVADESMDGQFHALAVWPEDAGKDEMLQDAAEETLRKQQPLITPLSDGQQHLGSYPLFIDGRLRAVTTLLFRATDAAQLHRVLATIEYCSGWLELNLARNLIDSQSTQNRRQQVVVDSIAQVLGETDFEHAALRFVNLLGRHLQAERVVLGFVRGQELVIHSQSDSSGHSKKHELVKLITEAMQEATDQQETILWPAPDALDRVAVAHGKLAESQGNRALMTVPLVDQELCYGAVLFDRPGEHGFSTEEQLTAEALANFVGVVLEEKRQSNLPLYSYFFRSVKNQLSHLLGPGYLTRKLVLLSLVAIGLFLAYMPGSYYVGADAVVEGAELRALVVPFDGYLESANLRAGDSVEKGAELAVLDTRESRLQRMSWISQQATSRREYEDSLANQKPTQVQISKAQMERAQAEIELLDFRIAQARLVAPFDALIVSGDLNQRIGSLVRQGEVLFELSPSQRFRLAMYVDEFRIRDIHQQQTGKLVLAALPDERFAFAVTRINPTTEVRDGATVYRVEAELTDNSDMLGVGLEGVARVYVDERLLVRIWTRGLIDWMKLQMWRFWG